jgi:RNA polymerase sigma-70 factor, ECF subfamily
MAGSSTERAALLERLHKGEYQVLGRLFALYRRRLRVEIARDLAADPRLGARFDASDIVQEVFFDAQRQITGYLARGAEVSFYTWLRGLARERRLKFLRQHLDAQCRSVRRQRPLPDDSREHPAISDKRSVRATSGEEHDRVRSRFQQLRAEDQEVIRLRVTEGRTNLEVAVLLGLTPAAVAKRLQRALRRLKATMADDGTE